MNRNALYMFMGILFFLAIMETRFYTDVIKPNPIPIMLIVIVIVYLNGDLIPRRKK